VSGQIKVGTYTGNASDNRDITGIGFDPVLALVVAQSAVANARVPFSGESHAGDLSSFIAGGTAAANAIQSLGSGSFNIGTYEGINTNAVNYSYLAVTDVQPSTANGNFLLLL
jgi:hypothetical protein